MRNWKSSLTVIFFGVPSQFKYRQTETNTRVLLFKQHRQKQHRPAEHLFVQLCINLSSFVYMNNVDDDDDAFRVVFRKTGK